MATRCHILRLKCTKFDSGGAPPQIPLGSLQCFSKFSSWIKGPTSKGMDWRGGKGREGRGDVRLGGEEVRGVVGRGRFALLALGNGRPGLGEGS